jgi:hypothetical protein
MVHASRTRGDFRTSRSILGVLGSLALFASACGSAVSPISTPSTSRIPAPSNPIASTSPTGAQPSSSPTTVANPLFGTWRRTGSCTAFVGAMDAAGLIDLIGTIDDKWMAGGITPVGTDPTAAGYCIGATAVVHSHFFTPDGRFGSYDENGQQVDDGTYKLRGDDEIVFGNKIVVTYRIDATDHLSYLAVSSADCSAGEASSAPAGSSGVGVGTCRWIHGWAISAFYPGLYDRVH